MAFELTQLCQEFQKARMSVGLDDFCKEVKTWPTYQKLVDSVLMNSEKWGKKIGLGVPKQSTSQSDLSDDELKWKKFFKDHSFRHPEDARNFADAMEIVTGMKLNRFISFQKPSGAFFPSSVCIVPLKNPNSHSYKLGDPILSSGTSPIFIKKDGDSGDNMSDGLEDFRLADRDEIEFLLARIMYKNRSMGERLLINNLAFINMGA